MHRQPHRIAGLRVDTPRSQRLDVHAGRRSALSLYSFAQHHTETDAHANAWPKRSLASGTHSDSVHLNGSFANGLRRHDTRVQCYRKLLRCTMIAGIQALLHFTRLQDGTQMACWSLDVKRQTLPTSPRSSSILFRSSVFSSTLTFFCVFYCIVYLQVQFNGCRRAAQHPHFYRSRRHLH